MIPLSAVPRRVLGRTGLQVSVLGFGAAPLGDLYAQLDDGTAIAAVERAFELGINLIDTSPLYGHGLSEHRCGTALRRVPRQDIVVSTKVGRWIDPFHGAGNGSGFAGGQPHRAVVDYSYDGTMRSVEQSLLRLGTDRLDLLLIHDVDAGPTASMRSRTGFAKPWLAPMWRSTGFEEKAWSRASGSA